MKRDIYVNYMICKHLFVTISDVNQMSEAQKEYYMSQIEKYLNAQD
jgi:hypothetical protein